MRRQQCIQNCCPYIRYSGRLRVGQHRQHCIQRRISDTVNKYDQARGTDKQGTNGRCPLNRPSHDSSTSPTYGHCSTEMSELRVRIAMDTSGNYMKESDRVPASTAPFSSCCGACVLLAHVCRRQAAFLLPLLQNLHGRMVPLVLDLLILSELKGVVLTRRELQYLRILKAIINRTSCTGICMYRHPWATLASSNVLTLETLGKELLACE